MAERAALRAPHRPRLETLESAPAGVELTDDIAYSGWELEGVAWAEGSSEFAELRGCALHGGTMAGSRWRRASWSDLTLGDVDAANAQFDDSGWTRIAAERCRATGLNLAGCTVSDLDIRDSRVDLANLRYAKLSRCRFTGCLLTGAEFIGATLDDVRFDGCRLEEASFANARCQRVRLEGCSLTGLKGVTGLAGATIDALDVVELAEQLAAALKIKLA